MHVTPEQSSPAPAMTAVANDVSLDSTDGTSECALAPVVESMVDPYFSTPSVEACTPKVDVPIPQIQEQIIEGIKEICQEHLPGQSVEQIVDDPILPILHMIKTKKEGIERCEKRLAALLKRVTSRERRKLQKPIDECNSFLLREQQIVQSAKDKLASLMREMHEKRRRLGHH